MRVRGWSDGRVESSVRPFAGVEPSRDVGAARWLVDRLHPLGRDVGSVVPPGFAAYVRLEHPVEDPADEDDEPWEGGLLAADAEALAALLAGFTSTPDDCWFGLWDGYGDVTGAVAVFVATDQPAGAADAESVERAQRRAEDELDRRKQAIADVVGRCGRVDAPDREYLLFRGPVSAVTAASTAGAGFGPVLDVLDGPNLWWPADRAWVVASEIDLAWTYVAGPEALADTLLADPRFAASLTAPTDPIVPH
jgi:hypothetical protein